MSDQPTRESWHSGRAWSGTEIEDSCPCPKAPCGLVDGGRPKREPCEQHQLNRTIRQSHRASDCPEVIAEPVSSTPCNSTYPRSANTPPNTRIVHCTLPAGHDGDHEETDTESTWPADPVSPPEFAVPLRQLVRDHLERERAAYERGKAEATEGWDRTWSVRYSDRFVLGLTFTEAGARQRAEETDGEPVSRLVGPWEPAEPAGGVA